VRAAARKLSNNQSPDAESFYQSRQQFQIILTRMELLIEDMEIDPKPSPETLKKYLDAILASMREYAKFLSDLKKKESIPGDGILPEV
jgi:hypothetical protein